MKRRFRIAVVNGLSPEAFKHEVLDVNGVGDKVVMTGSLSDADIVVFGPYGSDVPPVGSYIRVAYICENVRYDGPACDFLFRISASNPSGLPSARIQWHGFDPRRLIKESGRSLDAIIAEKSGFCAFIYGNRVPYREYLFDELSKYGRIDAPGLSRNNAPTIDDGARPGEGKWEVKRRFLRRYRFTLAFENEMHPGYQTEKLHDAMLADSIPVYLGDREVGSVFDKRSFLTVSGAEIDYWVQRLENFTQLRWLEIFGTNRNRLDIRVIKKMRRLARDAGHLYYARKVCGALAEKIITLDRDENAYRAVHKMPWLINNEVPVDSYSRVAWRKIFAMAARRKREERLR